MTATTTAQETNPIAEGYYDEMASGSVTLAEVARRGGKVTRVRFLTERTPRGVVADLSYVHAVIDGKRHNVRVDMGYLIPRHQLKGELIAWAKREGVYAKALGLLDEHNWSVLS